MMTIIGVAVLFHQIACYTGYTRWILLALQIVIYGVSSLMFGIMGPSTDGKVAASYPAEPAGVSCDAAMPSSDEATSGGLDSMTSEELEECVAALFERMGYSNVSRVGGSGDRRADVIADRVIDPLGNMLSFAIQCKRYASHIKVGGPDIRHFYSDFTELHEADRGIFVTTSSFTEEAQAIAKRYNITLIDGNELDRLLMQYGITYQRPKPVIQPQQPYIREEPSVVAVPEFDLWGMKSKFLKFSLLLGLMVFALVILAGKSLVDAIVADVLLAATMYIVNLAMRGKE